MNYNEELIKEKLRLAEKVLPAEGPWQGEDHRVEFEHAGFPCLLQRNWRMGHWCAYVGVGKEHPYFRKDYGDIDYKIDVHGCLTYSDECDGFICHRQDDNNPEDQRWWFGFDCAHAWDLVPGYDDQIVSLPGSSDRTYKTQEWVIEETKKLAEQLAEVASGNRRNLHNKYR